MPTKGIRLDGDALRAARSVTTLPASEVARALELHPEFYRRAEAGRGRVSLTTLRRIEGYFDVTDLSLVHPDDRHLFRPTAVSE